MNARAKVFIYQRLNGGDTIINNTAYSMDELERHGLVRVGATFVDYEKLDAFELSQHASRIGGGSSNRAMYLG